MEITEVRIKLVENSSERLRAFCSITLDGDFVIRDLKIIDGTNGVFVAMPSRKLMDRCPRCGSKNHLRARHCNECGSKLAEDRAPRDAQGRGKLHADVAHPINAACRERVQNAVIEAYHAEIERASEPGYKPQQYDDYDDYEDIVEEAKPAAPAAAREIDTDDEQAQPAAARSGHEGFSDYNSLIADLKRDAEHRRPEDRPSRSSATSGQRSGQRSPDAGAPEPRRSAQPAGAPAPTSRSDDGGDDFGAGL